MELIKINDCKLKVMLSEIDLKCYNLDCDKLDYDCSATKQAFREILKEAKKEIGFDTAEEKIFVQIYPGRCGGCEMYVTKLGFDEVETELHALSACIILMILPRLPMRARFYSNMVLKTEARCIRPTRGITLPSVKIISKTTIHIP